MRISGGASIAVVLLCTVLGGCALNRSEITLGGPDTSPPATPVTKARAVVIRTVADERRFEEAPAKPSTPSLGFEGASQATAELKARAIGRKRNSFGQAMGDIVLEEGQTVSGVLRVRLAAALRQAGYRVVTDAAQAGPAPLVIDVRIRQFWAWFQPGFAAITLSALIETDLEVAGLAAPMNLRAHAQDQRQFGGDSAWVEILEKALSAYQAEAVAKAAGLP